jgi:hypothetical protein
MSKFEAGTTLISEFGTFLQYGVLGLSGILAILGFFIVYRCVSENNSSNRKINIAKYFLNFSLIFLVVAFIFTATDKVISPEVSIRVEIEPWQSEQSKSQTDNSNFFIKIFGESIPYKFGGVVTKVKEESTLSCVVYPLHDDIKNLQNRLAILSSEIIMDQGAEDAGL